MNKTKVIGGTMAAAIAMIIGGGVAQAAVVGTPPAPEPHHKHFVLGSNLLGEDADLDEFIGKALAAGDAPVAAVNKALDEGFDPVEVIKSAIDAEIDPKIPLLAALQRNVDPEEVKIAAQQLGVSEAVIDEVLAPFESAR
ncbi:hypothetical protein [Amycolatopsis anabasis]|uniref:hypothetical protein n=1 Tax=Amycolatopsis anabasis TaxID=1840409 RepID=UPI00131C3A1B|nr:hypothetical protein [Amycolatopsis anabasis]